MDATSHLSRRRWAIVILAGFTGTTALGQTSGEAQFTEGHVVVKAVDDRRVLVAVDTEGEGVPPDGRVDHLFLFTSSVPLPKGVDRDGHARVEFRGIEAAYVRIEDSGQALELVVRNDSNSSLEPVRAGTQRLSESVGLSHFSGFAAGGFPMHDLQALRVDSQCDHVPGSCYRVGDFAIMFPS